MPRKPESLTLDEKIRIAIGILALESFEKTNPAKTIAERFDIPTKTATTLRNQAYEAVKEAFLPKVVSTSKESDIDTLLRGLDKLVGSPTSQEEIEVDATATSAKLDEIWKKIKEYNSSNDKKIYPSSSVLSKVSNLSDDAVASWLDEHQSEVKEHIEEFALNSVMNKGKRNISSLLGY